MRLEAENLEDIALAARLAHIALIAALSSPTTLSSMAVAETLQWPHCTSAPHSQSRNNVAESWSALTWPSESSTIQFGAVYSSIWQIWSAFGVVELEARSDSLLMANDYICQRLKKPSPDTRSLHPPQTPRI